MADAIPSTDAGAFDDGAATFATFALVVYADQAGYLATFSGIRQGARLSDTKTQYFPYPHSVANAWRWLKRHADDGREVYVCAHLLTDKRRVKANAAPIASTWCDAEAAPLPEHLPVPTMRVASSPGREHWYWALTTPVSPEIGESFNHRIAHTAIGTDAGGWDLTQLLRVPGMPNRKYADSPLTRIADLDPSRTYDPERLDRLLPPLSIQARPHQPEAITTIDAESGEPPVRLPAYLLPVWRGERPVTKLDGSGEIDRSASLWAIARALWKHNASRRTLAAALAERDLALGWDCYGSRPMEYERMAAKIAQEVGRSTDGDTLRVLVRVGR
jgi:hypothetical protein